MISVVLGCLCSETEGGIGKATEPEGQTSGGVVSEQEGKVSYCVGELRV